MSHVHRAVTAAVTAVSVTCAVGSVARYNAADGWAAQELHWYYTEADGACGLRSPAATVLEVGELGVMPTHSVWTHDPMPERVLRSAARAREVTARLAELDEHDQRVLELQYGAAATTEPVSVSLAAEQQVAVASYQRAVAASKLASRCRDMTIRGWLTWLSAHATMNPDSPHAVVLHRILTQARSELRRALARYRSQK